jgi:EmrB/QacA subfamily drug resistance transporter
MESLIVFRGIQGIGAGAIFPISLAVIGDLFTPAERGKYQGLFGAVFGVSAILGPLLGGWLTDNASWNWIFYVNLPIGAVALYIIWRYLPAIKRTGASRNLDYLGAAIFTVAITFLLVGLTNKERHDWTDLVVGGFLAIAFAVGALFLLVESRAKEPIVPLDLFRNRSYAVSIPAVFLASFGFFAAVVFLPRWFQVVKGVSPTESGLQTLALLAGVIISSIASGAIISRTGRYKWLIVGSMATLCVGLYLMTGLTYTTDDPTLWLWMFVTGIGVGPSLAAFTIVVQSAVPFEQMGVATGNLTFFRQIGGSVALAIAGTIFGQTFAQQLEPSLVSQGIPAQFAGAIASQAQQSSALTQVGGSLRDGIAAALAGSPAAAFVDQVVNGIYQAFSLAVASTFWVGLVASLGALIVTLALPQLPLRGIAGARRGSAPARPAAPETTLAGMPGAAVTEPVRVTE